MRALVVIGLLGGGACAPQAPLDGAPCPCAEGWRCCGGDLGCHPDDAPCPCRPAQAPTPLDVGCADAGGAGCAADAVCLEATTEAADSAACCPDAACLTPGEVVAGTPRTQATAWRTFERLTIDGARDDWTGVPRVDVARLTAGSAPVSADLSARFAARWDDVGLQVLVEVTDDLLAAPDSGDVYHQDDSIEVFLDMDPADLASADYDASEHQMFIRRGVPIELTSLRGWTVNAAFAGEVGSWWTELEIEWPTGFAVPRAGDLLGFDVAVDDDDAEGADTLRENQLFWNDPSGMLCCDARLFGLLRLDGGDCF